jgi:hypothetical protein
MQNEPTHVVLGHCVQQVLGTLGKDHHARKDRLRAQAGEDGILPAHSRINGAGIKDVTLNEAQPLISGTNLLRVADQGGDLVTGSERLRDQLPSGSPCGTDYQEFHDGFLRLPIGGVRSQESVNKPETIPRKFQTCALPRTESFKPKLL